ncbi:MAG: CBS domain-containing protein [Deltaproteobacteria bacterium]|nr:CBS domain-containing protein [Deltaproteobacteria bacterium]
MRIHDFMTTNVSTCSPDTTLDRATSVMWDHNCGCLPVLVDGRVVGVLTDRDVAVCAWSQGQSLGHLTVDQAMAHHAITIKDEADVEAARQVMRTHNIHRLPVIDANDLLVGIVSDGDLARLPRRARHEAIR